MKRHPSLHPLSRDHHHALVQARALSLAVSETDSEALRQAAANFTDFWESDLQAHFSQEEQFVLPLLPPDETEVRETLRQHADIRRLKEELSDGLARQKKIEANLLGALGEALRQHIRFEENELFPALEALATDEEMRRMNEQLETTRSQTGPGSCALSPRPQTTEAGR